MAVAITRLDLAASDLRQEASRTRDACVVRRLLAIALVLEGCSREDAAESCGMDRQTLRDWVHRYNDEGIAGLSNRAHRNGPAPRLTSEQEAELIRWIEHGPDLERDGVVRWRRVDLRARIEQEFSICFHERTVGKIMRKLGFRRLSVRPHHPQKDAAAQEAFKASFPFLVSTALTAPALDRPLEIWFADEARVGQRGALTRVWGRRGSRPPAVRDHRYDWAYLFGAICPARATGAAVVMPAVNAEAMTEHLKAISACVARGWHALVILDGAGWHQTGDKLAVPDNITLLPLPPYAPELNPVENIWLFLRQNFLSHRIWNSYEEIVDACCAAWNALMAMPERIVSIASRDWAKVG